MEYRRHRKVFPTFAIALMGWLLLTLLYGQDGATRLQGDYLASAALVIGVGFATFGMATFTHLLSNRLWRIPDLFGINTLVQCFDAKEASNEQPDHCDGSSFKGCTSSNHRSDVATQARNAPNADPKASELQSSENSFPRFQESISCRCGNVADENGTSSSVPDNATP